jgi:hypothetical protein
VAIWHKKNNVWDAESPVIENLTVDPVIIWPPDHKTVLVTVDYTASDNCSGQLVSVLFNVRRLVDLAEARNKSY